MTGPGAVVGADNDFRIHDREVDRTIGFRRATVDRDLARLHAWLGYDHVKPYWELDLPLPAFRDRLAEKLDDDYLTPYVGSLDDVPMSYWECYWPAEDDLADYYDAEPGDRGIHFLIGPPEYLGHGYATPLLRAAVAMQFRHPGTDRVVVEPDARNDAVISVNESCGFESRGEFHFEEEEKTAHLMICERERFEAEFGRVAQMDGRRTAATGGDPDA